MIGSLTGKKQKRKRCKYSYYFSFSNAIPYKIPIVIPK